MGFNSGFKGLMTCNSTRDQRAGQQEGGLLGSIGTLSQVLTMLFTRVRHW